MGDISCVSPSRDAITSTCISYEVERQVRLDYGLIEVGRFRWAGSVDMEVRSRTDRIACNLALSPRPSHGKLVQLDDGGALPQTGLERLMLLNPGGTYRLSLPPGKLRTLYCEIERSALEELLAGPVDLTGPNWQPQFRARTPAIELLLNRMYDELRADEFASQLALSAYSHALCVELARCLRPAPLVGSVIRKGGLAPWRMRLLRNRIHSDAHAPRLPELADMCGMTVRQLSRAFRAEMGMALGAYILGATIDRAKSLLMRSDQSIVQIAHELGFASSASFSYSFRRSTGLLPGELRRRANLM